MISSKADKFSSSGHVACNRQYVWIANSYTGTITQLDASNGSLVRIIRARKNGLDLPGRVVVGGKKVWIANSGNDSVTELNASVALVQTVQLPTGGRPTASQGYGPIDLALIAVQLFVSTTSATSDSIVDIDVKTGARVQVIKLGTSTPNSFFGLLVVISNHIWVSNSNGNSLTEIKSY